MSASVQSTHWLAGLWRENPALVKLLGLCPLLAVSNSLASGTGLAIATLLTLMVSNLTVAALRPWWMPSIRIPLYVLVIASTVSIIDRLMLAYVPLLHHQLGLFLPLIVTNCLILGRAEAFASRQRPQAALADAVSMGVGFGAVLMVLGAVRELLGHGTLWRWPVWSDDWSFLLALLPPGAFVLLGCLLALHNLIKSRD